MLKLCADYKGVRCAQSTVGPKTRIELNSYSCKQSDIIEQGRIILFLLLIIALDSKVSLEDFNNLI